MSKPNRLNSRGAGHEGPHRTTREREDSRRRMRVFQEGVNVMGEGPALPPKEKLMCSNVALAEPRNDDRFKDIFTSHPSNSGRFSETTNKKTTKKKGK